MHIIQTMLPPSTNTEIRQVVGLFSFFRGFIPDFALYSGKLTALTRKNSKWKEGALPEDAQAAFEFLKQLLMKQLTLNNPDPKKTFFLYADASKGSEEVSGMLGWAIKQHNHKDELTPVGFGSRTLKVNEKGLPINYLEAIAIIDGYKSFNSMLQGRRLIIFTDNMPIQECGTGEK